MLALYGALSCSDDPTRVGRPPVVQGFTPLDQELVAFTGDTLVFTVRAFDPDQSNLRHWFTIDDSVVSGSTPWVYVVEDTGAAVVRCIVTDGEYDSSVRWTLVRHERINHPPVITSFAPVETNPTMIIETALEFTVDATDEDGDLLTYFFTMDGEHVSSGDRFIYTANELGHRVVEAIVSDGELFTSRVWDLLVTPVPDTDPPAEVIVSRLETGVEPGEIEVDWTAVGQDGMEGEASNYLVRTSPTPVLIEEDWVRASEQPGVPDPVPSGQTMTMMITGMIPGRFTHVTVRAVDDFGNLSPIGESPGAYTRGMRIGGRVRDAMTLAELPDMIVRLAHFTTSTDANGEFELIELPPVDGTISLLDELEVGVIGDYFDYAEPYVISHDDFLERFMLPDRLNTAYYTDFYQFYLSMTDRRSIPPTKRQRRWELPIDLYVPAFSSNGLNYQATVIAVAAEFDAILGTQFFKIVGSVPEPGVEVFYLSDLYADNFMFTEWTPEYYPLTGRIQFRTHYAPSTVEAFKVIIRHELGHALGLNHSEDPGHMMVGGQSPPVPWFTTDELNLIKAYYHIPRGVDMSRYEVE